MFSGSPVIYEPGLPVYVQEGGEFTLKCRYEDDLDTGVQWYFKGSCEGCKDQKVDTSWNTCFELEQMKELEVRYISKAIVRATDVLICLVSKSSAAPGYQIQ